MLYSVFYYDQRERRHVVVAEAPDKASFLKKVIAHANEYSGLRYDVAPDLKNVIVVNPSQDDVQVIYHDDYD